ncbi:MAG: M56 family metallopeptidase [Oscillospiraceae bacterium]
MLEWIVSSSVLAALMIVLRYLLRGHISLRLQYSIWLILLLRLLLPVSLGTSPVSVANALPQAAEFNYVQTNQSQGDDSSVYITPPQVDSDTSVPAQQPFDWAGLAMKLWAAGALVLLLWFTAINLSLWKKLCRSRRRLSVPDYPLSVYITNNIEAPCLFGLFRPCVYLTPETAVDGPALRHVLEHEGAHWRHGDHIWALMRGLCLALHWYNPLVWWAAPLPARRDRTGGSSIWRSGTVGTSRTAWSIRAFSS